MDGIGYPKALSGVNVGLACIDGVLAIIAFLQLLRIHSRNSHLGWTRQKVFHLLIGSSNLGYFIYFILTLVAAYKGWACWSYSCGFIFMALPNILHFSAFLLLLSLWVDLCHQSNDDDDDDDGYGSQEALLEKTNKERSDIHIGRRCCSFRAIYVGSRQKIVILVTLLVLALMAASAVLMWFGKGKVSIDSLIVARVWILSDFLFSFTFLLTTHFFRE